MTRVALVTVAVGAPYERYAEQLGESAREFFLADEAEVGFHVLPGRPGWPAATLFRYHVVLEHAAELAGYDYLYLVDADMRFEARCGAEILGGLVATLHPGYVGRPRGELPYESRPVSRAYVDPREGTAYYAGGFVGGEFGRFLSLAERIASQVDDDSSRGVIGVWHDESHINAVLARTPPDVALSPAFCFPDDASGYVDRWPEPYERILVALDKTPAERGGR